MQKLGLRGLAGARGWLVGMRVFGSRSGWGSKEMAGRTMELLDVPDYSVALGGVLDGACSMKHASDVHEMQALHLRCRRETWIESTGGRCSDISQPRHLHAVSIATSPNKTSLAR